MPPNSQKTKLCSYHPGSNVHLIYANANRRNRSAQWSAIGRQQNTCWWISIRPECILNIMSKQIKYKKKAMRCVMQCNSIRENRWAECTEWIYRYWPRHTQRSRYLLHHLNSKRSFFWYSFFFFLRPRSYGPLPVEQCCNKCLSWTVPRSLRHSAKTI